MRASRPLPAAAAVVAALSLLCALLAFILPGLLTSGYYEKSLAALRDRSRAVQKVFAALARDQEEKLDALTRRALSASTEGRFDRLRSLGLDPDIEGVALYTPGKRLDLWLGRVANLEDLLGGTGPALTPSFRPKHVLLNDKASSFLALVHRLDTGAVVVLYRLLAFAPQLKAASVEEYGFLPARLQRSCEVSYWDFREDVTGFERIFAYHKDEYVGQPQLQSEVQSVFFPLRTAESRIVATVTLRSPTRAASRLATRDALLTAAGLLAALALVLFVIWEVRRPAFRRDRRPAPALLALGAIAAFRALFFFLGRFAPAAPFGVFSPAPAGFVSVGGLTGSPADIFLTALVLFAAAAGITFYFWPRPRGPETRRDHPPSLPALAALTLPPFLLAGLAEVVGRLVANSNVNLLRFTPTAAFLLLQVSLFLLAAGIGLLTIMILRRGLDPGFRTWPGLAVLGAAEAVVFVLIGSSRPGPFIAQAAALAALAGFALVRHPEKRRGLAALAGFAGALFLSLSLQTATTAKTRALAEGFIRDTVLSHERWARFLLTESMRALDRERKTLLAYLKAPGPADLARRLWSATLPAKFNWYSGLEIHDHEGAVLSRFALNVPKIFRVAANLPPRPEWTMVRTPMPFMGKEKEFLVGYRDWAAEGKDLGRTILYVSLDYDMLPFLYSANPYFELLRSNSLPSLVQFDLRFAVYGPDGRLVFNPNKLSTGLAPSVLSDPLLEGPGVRTVFRDKGRAFDLFAFRSGEPIYAVLAPRPGFVGRAAEFFKLLALYGLLAFIPYALASWTAARRGGRHPLWSFANRVYVSFMAVAFVPLVLFGFFSSDFFGRLFAQQFIEKAEVQANMARSVMDDFLYFQREERTIVEAPPEDLVLWISTTTLNDVNLYRDGRLVSSSRREFFDDGLLPDLLDGETYYQIQFENHPFYARIQRLGAFSYRTLTVPYTSLDPPLLISLPFPFEQQEIAGANRDLVEFLVFVGALFIATVLALARGIGVMIVSPIRRLLAGTREAALGNLEFAVEHRGRDEMRTLVDGFNAMIRSLKDHQRELADLGQKAAWAEMARKVAHEVKNPLTPIQLSAEHLLRVWEDGRADFGSALRESISYIISEVENLRRISQDFLDQSKTSVLHKEPIEVDRLMGEAVEPYRRVLADRIVFHETYAGADLRVLGDRDKLKIAFRNLLINAVESIRGPGEIHVSTARAAGRVLVEIADTGPGIDPEILERIFEPYFSTKAAGTGLGLPITRKIVEDHGGSIRIDSRPGRGTRVAIELPAAPPG